MNMPEFQQRQREIKEIWADKENIWLYALLGFFVGLSLGQLVRSGFTLLNIIESLFPEAVGILVTVTIIERWNERRSKQELKQQLMRQLRSVDKGFALNALEELKAMDALHDGTLVGGSFYYANLPGADFVLV